MVVIGFLISETCWSTLTLTLSLSREGIFRESIFNALGQALFGDQSVDQLDGAARALGHLVVVCGDDHREVGLGLQFA